MSARRTRPGEECMELQGSLRRGRQRHPVGGADGGREEGSTMCADQPLALFSNFFQNEYGGLTTPRRLFGTYYCVPGGAGPTSGEVNGLCYAHDTCFNNARINADGNTNPNIYWSLSQVHLARECNQDLYNALKQISNATGSQSIRLWLLYGDQLGPLSILRSGTHVHE